MSTPEHFDIVLVGAGISALGIAHHLQEQCPSKSFVLLESKDTFGGTWVTHTYPGIRSDSDLYTFGYRFKPWTGAPVADADVILRYLEEVIEDDKLGQHIRYSHEILAANWDDTDKRWMLKIRRTDTDTDIEITCDFFIWSGGYYDHKQGYTPDWPGFSDYAGRVVHPQSWPDDIDLKDKNVVVIGSGATAATLIPNICDDCAHVTMLQRSPTYFWTEKNNNDLADRLRKLDVPEEWVHEIVRRDLLETQREVQQLALDHPEFAKEVMLQAIKDLIGEELTAKHFTPSYQPWRQRIAYVPDADLFNAVKEGKASVVTDHIEKFTPDGILLQSGEELKADIVVTATGFNLSAVGGIPLTVNGNAVNLADTVTYRGVMLSGVPNFAMMFGYFRTSWTMRVDLVADYLCRLFNHMSEKHVSSVKPTLRPEDEGMEMNPWVSEEEFNPGYMKRSIHLMPKCGDHEPWVFSPDYYAEREQMPLFDLDEDQLVYA